MVTEITETNERLRESEAHLHARNEQLALVARVSHFLIFSEGSEDELLTGAFGEVARAIGAEMYFNFQPHADASMRLCHWSGLTRDEQTWLETTRYGDLLCGRVAARRQPIIVEDIARTDVEGSEALRAAGHAAYAGFPLLAGDRLLGTIAFVTRTKTRFAEGEVQMVQTVCDQVAAMLERTRLTQALKRSEHRHRTLVETASAVTWSCPPSGLHIEPQPGWMAFTGQSAAEMLGAGWTTAIHPDDVAGAARRWDEAVRRGAPFKSEHRIRRHDAQWRWMSVSAVPIRDERGEIVEWFGMSLDLTERYQAKEALRVTGQRLKTAVDASQAVLFHQDLELRYTWILNPALGYAAEHVIGARDTDLFQRSEDAARIEAIKRSVIETGVARREEVLIMDDGQEHHYDLLVQPDRDAYGAIVGVRCAAMDVTRRKRAEIALRERRERQAFLLSLSEALRPLAAPDAIIATACRLLSDRVGVDRAYFAEVNEAKGLARVQQEHLRGGSPPLIGEHSIADLGWAVPAMKRGETLIVADVQRSALVPTTDRSKMAAVRIGAHVDVPLVTAGELVGALCVTEPSPRAWTAVEVELVEETSQRIWAAVERARFQASLRESEERLHALAERIKNTV